MSYTTLTTDPDRPSTRAALLYAAMTANFTRTLLAPDARPIVPAGTIVNVNYAAIDDCPTADSYQFVASRLLWDPLETDTETCGSDHLPSENSVLGKGCYVTVSVLNASSKLDVNATVQAQVFERLQTLPLTCVD